MLDALSHIVIVAIVDSRTIDFIMAIAATMMVLLRYEYSLC
jgi:hypothetical protein